MPKASSFVIDVVETGYRLDGTPRQWFERVLASLRPELERGLGLFGVSYRFAGERLVLNQLVGQGGPDSLLGFVHAMYASVSSETARAINGNAGNLSAFSEFLRRLPRDERRRYEEALATLGFRDALLVGYPDGDGGWLTFAAFTDRPLRTFPRQRHAWSRMCAHLATAWRLRQRLDTPAAAIDAVVSPTGTVLEATGAATAVQRERLSFAAKAIDLARGPLRRSDPEAALEVWRGLVSGRWSLVERAAAGEATVLVAHQNEPRNPDPRGLSPRERAIVDLVLTGASNKHVAWSLGLSEATVASHLGRALRKLGLTSRVDLMGLGPLAGGRASRARIAETGVDVLVLARGGPAHDLPLTEAERAVALLVRDGHSNAEIARRRGTSARTVANQLASAFGKLGVGSRAELALLLSRATTTMRPP